MNGIIRTVNTVGLNNRKGVNVKFGGYYGVIEAADGEYYVWHSSETGGEKPRPDHPCTFEPATPEAGRATRYAINIVLT